MGTGVEEIALGLGEAGAAAEGLGAAEALGAGAAGAEAAGAATALGAGVDYGVGSLAGGAGFGLANALPALGSFESLTGTGLGLGGIDYATAIGGADTALGGAAANLGAPGYSSALPGSLNPAGIYATPTGASLSPFSGIQSLQGVGVNSLVATPTQIAAGLDNPFAPINVGYETPSGFEIKQAGFETPFKEGVPTYDDAGRFLGNQQSAINTSLINPTSPLTGVTNPSGIGSPLSLSSLPEFPTYQSLGDLSQAGGINSINYANQLGNASAVNTDGFWKSLGKGLDPTSDTSFMDRLSSLGNAGMRAADQIFTDKNGRLNMPAVLAGLSLYPTYAAAKAKAGELGVPFSESDYQANKVSPYKTKFATMAPKSAFGIKAANGGRIGYGEGIGPAGKMSNNRISQLIQLVRDADAKGDKDAANEALLDLYRETKKAKGGRIGYEDGKLVIPKEGPANKATREQMERAAKQAQEEYAKIKAQEKLMDENYKRTAPYESLKDLKTLYDMAPDEGYPPMPEPKPPEGVLSIKLTPAQRKAHGGMMNHPVRMLKGGISELDLRAKGGYIPYGVKEKADDVPAMLSKNEFVFTADAVRNAGGGNVNKGALKMYKLMKSLENKKINKKKVN